MLNGQTNEFNQILVSSTRYKECVLPNDFQVTVLHMIGKFKSNMEHNAL